ncbi:MAG: hypothetical protein FJ290_32915 [Planctomycetes bacterium]|nr:hypothetical protein [Planctomycetota bacterium]
MISARLDLALALVALVVALAQAAEPIALGSRLELMVDDHLAERLSGAAQLRLQSPIPREICLALDAPWEGNGCGYVTVLQDGDTYRMYYRGHQMNLEGNKVKDGHPMVTCVAESKDGIRWTRPELGLVEFGGSKKNNIIRVGELCHDFSPFVDANPACPPEARYKAVAAAGWRKGLLAYQSPDGLRWSPVNDGKPIITQGAFDTQNITFWDAERGEYRAYVRDFRDGLRDIRTATSKDFIHWTEPTWLVYPGAPKEHLYTNQIRPYHRAPHIFVGFPTRYIDRGWSPAMEALSEVEHRRLRSKANNRYGTALTEGLLMTSRDGLTFHRWHEAFLRPGLRLKDNWKYGDNYIAWHLVETKSHLPNSPNELSLYATEGYWTGESIHIRRYTLRLDGFASASAPMAGGELLTKPLTFAGKTLVLNLSTSAAGTVKAELQDPAGKPLPGCSLADCPDIFGDSLEYAVTWKGGSDISALAGTPIRLRLTLRDADLFGLRFR